MSTANEVLRWKERRTLLPVWVSLGVLFLFGLLAASMTRNLGPPNERPVSYLLLFWISSSVIGLATGIMMFVPEREHGTDMLLGRLPVESKTVSKVKLVQAVLVFVLFMVVTGAIIVGAYSLRYGENLLNGIRWQMFAACIFIPVQTFLWSSLCSLWFRSSLKAVLWAAALAVIGWVTLSAGTVVVVEAIQGSIQHEDNTIWFAIGANGLLVLILAAAIGRLSSTWLRGIPESTLTSGKTRQNPTAVASISNNHTGAYSFKSLMWQSYRQIRWSMLVLGIGVVVYVLVALATLMQIAKYGVTAWVFHDAYKSFFLAFAVITAAFTGLTVFRGDQSNKSFLFFQQQADFPRKVWLSRILTIGLFLPIVILPLILMSAFIGRLGFDVFAELPSSMRNLAYNTNVLNGMLVFLMAFSLAQLVSITCRSGILAFFMTVAIAFGVSFWCDIILKTNEPLFWFAVPVIFTGFLASWWYAPRWISQLKPIRSIAIPIAFVVSMLVACSIGYVWQRVSIPHFEVAAEYEEAFESHDEFLKADKERFKSVFLLKEAMAALDEESLKKEQSLLSAEDQANRERWPAKMLADYVTTNEVALADIEEALSDDLVYHWPSPNSVNERLSSYRSVANTLAMQSEHFTRDKDVANSLDSLTAEVRAAWRLNPYPSIPTAKMVVQFCQWSEMEGQTDELLRKGVSTLKRLRGEIFDPKSKRIQHEVYFKLARDYRNTAPNPNFVAGVLERGPEHWESIRRHRNSLNDFAQFDRAVSTLIDRPVEFWDYLGVYSQSLQKSLDEEQFDGQNRSELLSVDRALDYALLRVALQVWRLEHGGYPKSLDALAGNDSQEAILNEVPNVSGRDVQVGFTYYPEGLNRVAHLPQSTIYSPNGWQKMYDATKAIPAHTPMLLPYTCSVELRTGLTGFPSSSSAKLLPAYFLGEPVGYGPAVNLSFINSDEGYCLPVVEAQE